MALITRRGTGRFRCQKTDPGGVWSRLEPRGKALQRNVEEKELNISYRILESGAFTLELANIQTFG